MSSAYGGDPVTASQDPQQQKPSKPRRRLLWVLVGLATAVVLAVVVAVTVRQAGDAGASNEPHVTLSADDQTTCAEVATALGGMVDDAKALLAARHYQTDRSAFVLETSAFEARRRLEGYNVQAAELAQRVAAASTALDELDTATRDDDRPYDETGHPPLTAPSATTLTAAQAVVSSGTDLTDFCRTNA